MVCSLSVLQVPSSSCSVLASTRCVIRPEPSPPSSPPSPCPRTTEMGSWYGMNSHLSSLSPPPKKRVSPITGPTFIHSLPSGISRHLLCQLHLLRDGPDVVDALPEHHKDPLGAASTVKRLVINDSAAIEICEFPTNIGITRGTPSVLAIWVPLSFYVTSMALGTQGQMLEW